MAARLRKTHQDDVRAKIQTSQLINRLQDHVLGNPNKKPKELELSPTQLRAIEILLKKSVPDLSQLQLGNMPGETLSISVDLGDKK